MRKLGKVVSSSLLFSGLTFGSGLQTYAFSQKYSNTFKMNGKFYNIFIQNFSQDKSKLLITDRRGCAVAFWYLDEKEHKSNEFLDGRARTWLSLYEEAISNDESPYVRVLIERMNQCAKEMGAEDGNGTWF